MLHIFYKHLFGKDTAMKLINYSLKVGKKKLLENVNISFDKKYINHILGSNGAGKSSFAKTCVGMLEFEGKIEENQEAILIGSSSNIPAEFTLDDVIKLLKKNPIYYKLYLINRILLYAHFSTNCRIKT